MHHTINFLYPKLLGSCIYACYGRVDNSCGAAGLTNNNISFHRYISFIFFVFCSRQPNVNTRTNS